jgi:tetratricopeptide (TPR) repeat protein
VLPKDLVAQRFEIERRAGSGGMGEVYQARDLQTNHRVALKVLKLGREEHADRFAREAAVLAEFDHPGIVRYVDHGLTRQGQPFLAMEWLEGETLAARLARHSLSIAESVTLALHVAEALAVLHRRNIVHRDLKPANLVLVGASPTLDRVKLLDFGIARFVGAGDRSLTRPGMLMGTPGFMAPEQARGEEDIDVRADVFALGCVLYRCLTGRAAFAGSDPLAILLKVMLEDAPRPSRLNAEVPQPLDELVARMLAKQREDRPADASVVAAALRALPDAEPRSPRRDTAPPPALTTAERRVMCLVLARITEGDEALPLAIAPPADSPTETPTIPVLLGARLRALRQAAERHRGLLDILADGSVVVVLASAGAATDLAARAARCALSMRDELSGAPMIVATGQGVLEASVPVGDVIERAVKMLEAALEQPLDDDIHDSRSASGQYPASSPTGAHPPTPTPITHEAPPIPQGSVRLDQATAGLLDERFDVRGDARGLYLRGERLQTSGTRTLLGKPTPTVGRTRELGTLTAIFDECVGEPVARAVLLTAPAGVGKSRVRYELLHAIQQRQDAPQHVTVWMGRGDPMAAGSPLAMIAVAIRRTMGLFDGEPLPVRQQKLSARVARHFHGDDATRVCEFLGELLGVPFPDERSVQLRAARQDALLMGDQMRRAWEDWVEAECRAGPLLLVLEDLHWGDLPTVRFVDAALRRLKDRPFMVLALARPEVHELFAKLWEDRGLLHMRLLELTRKASEKLVRQVLGRSADDATVSLIVERAEGNAFYLEELIRAVAQGEGTALPDTVLAMVQARLEGLEPGARRVLRAASVFGESFWEDGVLELCGGAAGRFELADLLTTLTDQEVVSVSLVSRFPNAPEYVFRHALVREVAYSMLTDTDRVLGHKLAGEWLERVGETDPLVLAEHFERGGEPHRAVAWYQRAAEDAVEGGDLDAAIARAQRGVDCGATGEVLGVLRILQAEAFLWRGQLDEADAHGTEAFELLPRGSPLWFRIAGGGVLLSAQVGRYDRLAILVSVLREEPPRTEGAAAQALSFTVVTWLMLFLAQREVAGHFHERLEELDRRCGADDPVARGWIEIGRFYWAKFAADDLEASLRHARAAVAAFESAGDVRTVGLGRLHVGWALTELGGYREAVALLREVISSGEKRRLGVHVAHGKRFLAPALALAGSKAEGYKLGVEAKALLANNRMTGGIARKELARILVIRGELETAEREARASIEELSVLPFHRAHAQAILAQALLGLGRADEALAAARASIDSGNVADGDALARLVRAEALHALGREDEARQALASARDRLLDRARRIGELEWRKRFLERVSENARTIELAKALDA